MESIWNRAIQVVQKPKMIWSDIGQEHPKPIQLFTSYFLILTVIPAVAYLIGLSVVGIRIPFSGVYRMSFGNALILVIIQYILTVAGGWMLAKLIFLYTLWFQSGQDATRSFQLSLYSHTPMLLAGIFYIFPQLSILIGFAAIYGLYILWQGIKLLLKIPEKKLLLYSILILFSAVVIYTVINLITNWILNGFGPSLPPVS
ncbi:YIP1 family protein [bacterium]|nr:YIP1 family protein [bacterium]